MNSYEAIHVYLAEVEYSPKMKLLRGFMSLLHHPTTDCENQGPCYEDEFEICYCVDLPAYCWSCTEDFDMNNTPFPCYQMDKCAEDMGLEFTKWEDISE